MTAKDAIRNVIEFCDGLLRQYITDLSDRDLLVRSIPGTNHIAWQLGHLIASEHKMLAALGAPVPPLPDGFAESHSKEAATSDDPAKFHSRAEYMKLLDTQKAAALAALDRTSESQLDQPGPEPMRAYAPTVGAVFTLLGTHKLMHAGQFVPVRRKLGKAPLF